MIVLPCIHQKHFFVGNFLTASLLFMEERNLPNDFSTGKLTAVLILAAGFSSRMGSPKDRLMANNGETFLEYILYRCGQMERTKLILVHGDSLDHSLIRSDVQLIKNDNPEKGRFHSIFLGMKECDSCDSCLIQNIDNPYVDMELIQKMTSILTPESYVVPVINGRGGHPVLIGRQIMDCVLKNPGINNLKTLLNEFARLEVEYNDPRILLNINTIKDYEDYRMSYIINQKS